MAEKHVNKDELIAELNRCYDLMEGFHSQFYNGYQAAVAGVRKFPEIKKDEKVLCRDCKNYHADIGWCDEHSHFILHGEFCHPWESSEWKMFPEDYWCADGEMRKE